MRILIGWKAGMTQVFTPEGEATSVTVIGVEVNRVVRVVRPLGGPWRVQIEVEGRRGRVIGSSAGRRLTLEVTGRRRMREFSGDEEPSCGVGECRTVELLRGVRKVDVTGRSKGKGFAGVVKRWGFSTQDSSHGNSLSHRAPGAIGQNQSPGRVLKGKKMAGRLGGSRVTVQNLDVVKIDVERNFLLVGGSVPGPTGGELLIREAAKSAR